MDKLKLRFRDKIFIIGFIIAFSLVCYRACFLVTNEIGSLGMDKNGRQILIQTSDYYMPEDTTITSEWDDYNFLERLWQEPMRTTFRVQVLMSKEDEKKLVIAEGFDIHDYVQNIHETLNAPFEDFLYGYTDAIHLRENYSMQIEEFKKHCRDKNVRTVKELLGGFGFKSYQVFLNKEEIFNYDLPAKNLYHSEFAGWK